MNDLLDNKEHPTGHAGDRSQGRTLTHAPKKQKTSKLLTFNRHIKHIQTQQAPTINWLCISIAPTKTQTKKEQKDYEYKKPTNVRPSV